MQTLRRIAPAVFAIAAVSAIAQAPLRFEVVSIRPVGNGPEANAQNPAFAAYRAGRANSFCKVCISGSHYDYYGVWLKVLIGQAYGLDSRLVIGPAWLSSQEVPQFVIHAEMPATSTREQIPDMLKSMLAERFHLIVHRGTTEQPAYSLVVGRAGPKLKAPREMDKSACGEWVESNIALQDGSKPAICRFTQEEGDRTVNFTMNMNTGAGPLLSRTVREESGLEVHNEHFGITMAQLAARLSSDLSTGSSGMAQVGTIAHVQDKTGIEGPRYVVLDYISGDALSGISASLEKQGLHLERTTAQVETLIVDQVDKLPTEN